MYSERRLCALRIWKPLFTLRLNRCVTLDLKVTCSTGSMSWIWHSHSRCKFAFSNLLISEESPCVVVRYYPALVHYTKAPEEADVMESSSGSMMWSSCTNVIISCGQQSALNSALSPLRAALRIWFWLSVVQYQSHKSPVSQKYLQELQRCTWLEQVLP